MVPAIAVITLLTDFGDRDYFVASMKGVILGINPQARLIDLSHHIPAHDIHAAAYLLKASYRYFPDGTVHLAVVDPGVGTARNPLLVSTARYHFLAPDNGLLSYIYAEESGLDVRRIENPHYRLDAEGATFDGRDLFAPAAGWLTHGHHPESYGPVVTEYCRLPIPEPTVDARILTGTIIYVDRFGNLISNISNGHLRALQGATRKTDFSLRIAGVTVDSLQSSYAQGFSHAPSALINSNGQVEVFLKEGSAAVLLQCGTGEQVQVF